MSKHKFSAAQRYAIFKAFNGHCPWCNRPLNFLSFHIDHILPESLLQQPKLLGETIASYGLSGGFNINDYENWAPIHTKCNLDKSDSVFKGLGVIKTLLDECEKNKEKEQRIELKVKTDIRKSEFIAKVQAALEANFTTIHQLQNLILNSNDMDEKDEDLAKLGKELEETASFQADQMKSTIMASLRDDTMNEITSMATSLGSNWCLGTIIDLSQTPDENTEVMKYNLQNSVGNKYTCGLTIVAMIESKKLKVSFFNRSDERLDDCSIDIEHGINYSSYNRKLRTLYMEEVRKKVEQP